MRSYHDVTIFKILNYQSMAGTFSGTSATVAVAFFAGTGLLVFDIAHNIDVCTLCLKIYSDLLRPLIFTAVLHRKSSKTVTRKFLL